MLIVVPDLQNLLTSSLREKKIYQGEQNIRLRNVLRIACSIVKVWSTFPPKIPFVELLNHYYYYFFIVGIFQESIKADLYVQICFPRMTSRTVNRGKFKGK